MSVDIQSNPQPKAVLSRIPLTQIRPSPRNTRKIIRAEMIEARRASMANDGQANPITVRPLTDQEKSDEQDKNILFEIVDGEIRYRAALKNGDKEIDAYIKNRTPDEAFKESIKGNRVNKPGWFEDYLAMVELKKIDPNIQNKEIAEIFEVDNVTVSHALQFIPRLKNKAINEILEILQNPQKGLKINEDPIYRLNDLRDPDDIDKALPVVIERQLSEPQVKELVAWIESGQDPTLFEPTVKPSKPRTPKGEAHHEASDQGADSLIESAHPKNMAQLEAEPQGADSNIESTHPKSVAQLEAEPQGLSSPTVSTDPKGAPAEDDQPKWKGGEAAASGFWKDVQDIFQGFTGAGLKDLFGKIPQGNKWQALGYIFEKILLGAMGHLIELGWKLFILLAKHTGKGIHNFSKSIANMVMPISRSGSSHSHGSSSRSQNPFLYIGHWLVYGFITVVCYSILLSSIGNFVPGVGPWVRAEVMALAHLLAQVPLWVCYQILQNAWMAIGFGILLLWMIHKTFNPGFGWILTLGVILFVAWCLRGWVISGCHVTLPDFSSLSMPKAVEAPVQRPQADEHGLVAPISKPEMGAPPTQKTAQAKPTTPQHKKAAPGKKKTPIPLSQMALPMHIPSDSQFADAFCAALYNIKYQDPYFNSDAVAAMLTTDNGQDIVDGYYAEDRMKRIEDDKETWTFKADGDPVLTAKKGDDSDFLVKGSYSISVVGQSYVDVRPFSAIVTICHDRKGFPQVRDIQVQKQPEKD